jgi:hypothetical protein
MRPGLRKEKEPRLRHPGLFLVRRCARFGRFPVKRLCGPDVRSGLRALLALPLHVDLASASVQGELTVRGRGASVKYLGQVIRVDST